MLVYNMMHVFSDMFSQICFDLHCEAFLNEGMSSLVNAPLLNWLGQTAIRLTDQCLTMITNPAQSLYFLFGLAGIPTLQVVPVGLPVF
jgi:hypothetical protein